jgi:putative multiple sugar transport system substrate-binding protein
MGTTSMSATAGKIALVNSTTALTVACPGSTAYVDFVGYGTAAQPWPVVTGQDAEVNSVRSIQRGEQSSTVFKDTRQLAVRVASMVDEYMNGKPATINDTKTYNNGVKVVPSYLLKPVFVNKANWQQVLVESGFYQQGQI